MNLLEKIHERWTAQTGAGELNKLLDSSYLKTGINKGGGDYDNDRGVEEGEISLPFCEVTQGSGVPDLTCNCSDGVDSVGVIFQLFHENHAQGEAIVEQIKKTFHRVSFDLGSDRKVQSMRRRDDAEFEEDDGVWRFVVGFDARVYLPEGY